MRRRWILLHVALAGCNAVTGVSDLETVDGLASEDGGTTFVPDASSGEDVRVDPTDAGGGDAPPLDDGAVDAGPDVVDAGTDAIVVPCTPASSGPRYGSIASGNVWSNDNGILAPNDSSIAHTNGGNEPIVVAGFGFNIPSTARIDGIKVDFRRNAIGSVADDQIRLPKGTAKGNGAWPQGPLDGPYVLTSYGGATDTWGAAWTAAEIDAATFSVSIDITGNGDGHGDSVGVTVYYCQ